jgi:tRNA 2-thiouridine synthesizing protein A
MTETIVDARGMRCPWPALRLAKAMIEMDAAVLLADDPAAPTEIAALAAAQGWSLQQENGRFLVAKVAR